MGTKGKALDLFAGIGGMTLAAQSAGLSVVCAIGNSAKEAEIYEYNFGGKLYIVAQNNVSGNIAAEGITTRERNIYCEQLPDVDYIFGSISCPFQTKGINRGKNRGRDFSRADFFCDLLQIKAPKGFVVVLPNNSRDTLHILTEKVIRSGYKVCYEDVDSGTMTGMPVYDKKTYLVGIRSGIDACYQFPEIPAGYTYSVKEFMKKGELEKELFVDPSMISIDSKAEIYNYKFSQKSGAGIRQYAGDQLIRYGSWSPTLLVDHEQIRKISVRELARTKFFPDAFEFIGIGYSTACQMIGRSVNVYAAAQIIERLCALLEDDAPKMHYANRWEVLGDKEEERESERQEKEKQEREEREREKQKKEKHVQVQGCDKETGKEIRNRQKIFLSYCQQDTDIANLIERKLTPLISKEYVISRDIRDVKYKESFKKYMDSVREHAFVLMIISDRYMKSINCMYEMTEVFKDRDYEKKLLFFVLSDKDKKYFTVDVEESIAANIYHPDGWAKYTSYWKEEERRVDEQIRSIDEPVYTRELTIVKSKIMDIERGLPDFFAYISDAKGLPLEIHFQTKFQELRDHIHGT